MKKAANILYLLFIIITLGATGYLIYDDYQSQVNAARSDIEQQLIAHQQKLDDFFKEETYQEDKEFQSGIADFFKQDERLRGLILMIPGETLVYNHLESENEKLLETFETPELSIGPDSILYSYKTPFYESYQRPVTTGLEKNIQSFFIYEIFDNEDVYRNLKRSLMIIGSLFFLTLIILLLVSRSMKQEELEEDSDDPLLANIENNESWNTPVPSGGKEISNSSNEMDDSDFMNEMGFDLPEESTEEDASDPFPPEEDSNNDPSFEEDSLDNLAFDTDFPDEPEEAPSTDDDLGDFNFDMDDLSDDDEEMPKLDMDELDSLAGPTDEDSSSIDDMDFDLDDSGDEASSDAAENQEPMDFELPDEDNLDDLDDLGSIEDLDFDLDDTEEEAPGAEDLSPESADMEEPSSSEQADDDEEMGFDLPEEESLDDLEDLGSIEDMDFDLDDTEEEAPGAEDLSPESTEMEESPSPEGADDDEEMGFDLPEEESLEDLGSSEDDEDMSFDLPEEGLEIDEDDSLSFDLDDLENMEDLSDEGESSTGTEVQDSLYDKETGLSKEDFITERLDQELNRSASNNENLSVSFIQAEGLDEEGYRSLISEIKELSGNSDLNFKWQDQGICLIDQDKDLTSVLVALDQLNQKYSGILRVGTSARNDRLVESEQLLKEARHALDRTNEQKPVIGFQADPEKYRLLVSEGD